MSLSTLTALSPLDGRYATKTVSLRSIFSEYGLIKYRVIVEIRWLQALALEAQLPELAALKTAGLSVLEEIIQHFSEADAQRVKDIEATINHDVKAIEYFIKEKLADSPELLAFSEFIHFGCTSEDINNLAYALMLQQARQDVIVPLLNAIQQQLRHYAHTHAAQPMLARTHGQAATPTTVGKEFANVAARLERQLIQLNITPLLGKLNGATGNYSALTVAYPSIDWPSVSQRFVAELGLDWNAYTTQIEPHDYIAELLMTLIRINTLLIDLSRDMWGYIGLDYFTLNNLEHEVGSSTMPHKINPIDFENAEGNLGIANALCEHFSLKLPISRFQRDLSDSTVLRNLGSAIGYALIGYQSITKGLQKSTPNKSVMLADLNAHWEILAEPIQMVMRRHGITQPYEKLKTFTRGKKVDQALLHDFIQSLALDNTTKETLLALTPQSYLGLAETLAKKI